MITYRHEPIKEKIGFAAIVYSIYCALLPLNMILNFTGVTVNKYFGIISSAFFIIDIIRDRKTRLNSEYTVFIFFLMWAWLTLLWAINQTQSRSQLITLTSLVLITELGLLRGFNEKEIKLIKYSMIIPSSLIIFYLAPNMEVSYSRSTLQSSAGAADHNSLAANILFALLIAINEIKYEPKRWLKIVCIIYTVPMSISILMIASRGAYVAALIAVFVYFFLKRKDAGITFTLNDIIERLFIAALVIGAVVLILNFVPLPALERLTWEELFLSSGYGRVNLWSATWQAMWDTPWRVLIGFGYGTEAYVTRIHTGLYAGIHNVYLEHWATMGVIGLVLLMLVMLRPLIYARRHRDNLSVALVIALILVCIPLGFMTNKGAWNVLMLAYIGLQNAKQQPTDADPEESESEEDDTVDLEPENLEPEDRATPEYEIIESEVS